MVGYTRKHSKMRLIKSSKKVFSVGFGFSNFFRLLETIEFNFLLRPLKSIISAFTHVFWLVTPENTRKLAYRCPQKKNFWVGFGFSKFFRLPKTTEFIFLLGSLKSIISAWTYVFWLITQENTRKLAYRCPQKKNFGLVSGSRIFTTTWNDRIYLSSMVLKKYFISMKLCISVNYTRKQLKIRVSMSSKKVCCVRFGFSNFFRLLETIKFFFLLRPLKSIFSAWTYVFWFNTREKGRKLAYGCPEKKIFGSVSGSRIHFDNRKRPNFSFF